MWVAEAFPGVHFTWRPTFILVWGQNPDFKPHEENFYIFPCNHTFDTPYNNVWYLNCGFMTRWIISRGIFYVKTTFTLVWGQYPDFKPCYYNNFYVFPCNHTFDTPYSNVWCLNGGFVTRWIVSRGLLYVKPQIYLVWG